METLNTDSQNWSLLHKILFRFFFIYFLLHIAPWTWFLDDHIPGMSFISEHYNSLVDWAVNTSNKYFFHVRPVLIPLNGSGDTSYGWAQLCLYLSVAIIGCIVWTLLDNKRAAYNEAEYWL